MSAIRHAVQGTIETAQGEQVKLYPAKDYGQAVRMLADLEGVQSRQGITLDAEIVIVAADAPTTPTVVETPPRVRLTLADALNVPANSRFFTLAGLPAA
ncbi:MAG: hypothetical protein ABR585_07475 [Gemmatimonadaceae bacterium]